MKRIKIKMAVSVISTAAAAAVIGLAAGFGLGWFAGNRLPAEVYANIGAVSATTPAALQVEAGIPQVPRYRLGVSDGFVAVTGAEHGEILEMVSKPIIALPPEEQLRLYTGIAVFTEEELLRLLEDFGS